MSSSVRIVTGMGGVAAVSKRRRTSALDTSGSIQSAKQETRLIQWRGEWGKERKKEKEEWWKREKVPVGEKRKEARGSFLLLRQRPQLSLHATETRRPLVEYHRTRKKERRDDKRETCGSLFFSLLLFFSLFFFSLPSSTHSPLPVSTSPFPSKSGRFHSRLASKRLLPPFSLLSRLSSSSFHLHPTLFFFSSFPALATLTNSAAPRRLCDANVRLCLWEDVHLPHALLKVLPLCKAAHRAGGLFARALSAPLRLKKESEGERRRGREGD